MKKLSILILMVFLSGCVDADLQQAEQTKAQFHTYTTTTPDAADKLLFSDEDSGHAIHTVLANDLPVGTATQVLLDATINFGSEITLTNIILFDGAYTIQPGQYGMFSYDATNDEFVGGL